MFRLSFVTAAPRRLSVLTFLFFWLSGCGVIHEPLSGGLNNRCNVCPEMVPIKEGSFLLGSPAEEVGRIEDEGPQKRITIAPFALSRFEITVEAYREFAQDTGFQDNTGCFTMMELGTWGFDPQASWRNPGFVQGDMHPVVCVTGHAANTFVAWGDYDSFYLRSAYRGAWGGSAAFANLGFRVAMTLPQK